MCNRFYSSSVSVWLLAALLLLLLLLSLSLSLPLLLPLSVQLPPKPPLLFARRCCTSALRLEDAGMCGSCAPA